MIISIVGMPQSGSTMLFNIAAELLTLHNIKYKSSLFGTKTRNSTLSFVDLKARSEHELYLVKEHHYQEDLNSISDFVIVSKRKIKDSIASRRRRGKGLFSKGKRARGLHQYDENKSKFLAFKEWCNYLVHDCYESWIKHCNKEKILIFDYDDYYSSEISKEKFVIQLCELLKLNITHEQIVSLIDSVKIENLNNNPIAKEKNFFSMNRITNHENKFRPEDSLSKKEIEFINLNYFNYC